MKFKVVLEPSEEGGYTVYIPSLPGCISEGETVEEAMANIKDAVELYLEAVEDDCIKQEDAYNPGAGFVTNVPSLSYGKIIRALQRDGWTVVRVRGSHIRLQKRLVDEVLKLTIPAHAPVKRSTLSHVLKQARIDIDRFLELL